MMQTFAQKYGQRIVTNKGLASMGYGLSGAIGAAFAGGGQQRYGTAHDPGRRGWRIYPEPAGARHRERQPAEPEDLPLRRQWLCLHPHDAEELLRRPLRRLRYRNWPRHSQVGAAVPGLLGARAAHRSRYETDPAFLAAFDAPGAHAFLVHIDPSQTYFPKISSRVTESGSMESNPLHRMTPDLDTETEARVFRYL